MKDKIIELRQQGKTYQEIAEVLHYAKSTICYYLGQDQKVKNLVRAKKYRSNRHPYCSKLYDFINRVNGNGYRITNATNIYKIWKDKILNFFRDRKTKMYNKTTFTVEDVIKKFGDKPVCYLTGQPIDINKPSSYWFDHIIPVSRGGDNSLDNLGICSRRINIAKSDMTPDEFVNMCKQVLEYNNYNVSKKAEVTEVASVLDV